MKKYCEECGKEVEAKIITKRESYNVCGETIDVDAQILACPYCKEEFYCETLDSETLLNAYNEYRRRHKLLLPNEIKQIREQYGLSQRSFAKLLNWGDKTIHRYENGSIQDKAHNSLLLFLKEPKNMQMYLAENEIVLEERQQKKLFKAIENLKQNSEQSAGKKLIAQLFSNIPSIENGFQVFDYEKLCAMVLFFTLRSRNLLKTKLLKLLNYSDMVYYREKSISISGTSYIHLPYGPVPQNFDILFGMMTADHIVHLEITFDNGYEKHQVIPECDLPQHVLSRDELEVMEHIFKKFENFGSVEISEYSHREKGYRSTKQGEIISYSYAKDITLN